MASSSITQRTCKKCNKAQPIAEFHRNGSRFGYRSTCKECRKAEAVAYMASLTTEQRWSSYLWHKYRIRAEDYQRIYDQQRGNCAICGNHYPPYAPKQFNKCLYVDHDHNTGLVRGLVCQQCNIGIGLLGDSLESLLRAVNYLSNS